MGDGADNVTIDELPAFPQLWARWVTTAAAFAAARKPCGPRVLPLLAWFENGYCSGSFLHTLPDSRAALWGEIATSGSRDTLVIPFGYRWESGHWHQIDRLAAEYRLGALPKIWTLDETVESIIAIAGEDDEQRRATAVAIVCAVEKGTVTRSLIAQLFRNPELFDMDNAVNQFAMAGVLADRSASSAMASHTDGAQPVPRPPVDRTPTLSGTTQTSGDRQPDNGRASSIIGMQVGVVPPVNTLIGITSAPLVYASTTAPAMPARLVSPEHGGGRPT